GDERVQALVEPIDAREQVGDVVHRRQRAPPEEPAQLPDARVGQLVAAHRAASGPPPASPPWGGPRGWKTTAGSRVRTVRLSRARIGRSAFRRNPRTIASRFSGMG